MDNKTLQKHLEETEKQIFEHIQNFPTKYCHVRTVDQFLRLEGLFREFEIENANADGWGGD